MSTLTQSLKSLKEPHQLLKTLLLSTLFLVSTNLALAQQLSDYDPISHWSCDETSGVRYDSNTINSNDLSDTNGVSSATGLRSNACDFERSSTQYLSISDANQVLLDQTDDTYSISMWLKFESLPPSSDTAYSIYDKMDNVSGRRGYGAQYGQYPSSTYDLIALYGAGDNNWDSTRYSFSTATWYHVVITNNLGVTAFYVNSTLQASTTSGTGTNIGDSTSPFILGYKTYQNLYSNEYHYDGLMDEVSFFDDALSQSEVTSIYNSGLPLPYISTTTPPTATTSSSTVNMSDTNFLLVVIIFFLTFIFQPCIKCWPGNT